MKPKSIILALLLLITASARANHDQILWYDFPAANWETQALPIGNGNLGAMIFGGIEKEQIQFNQDSLWIGDESETGSYQAFGDVYVTLDANWDKFGVSAPGQRTGGFAQGVQNSYDDSTKTKWLVTHHNQPIIWQLRLPQAPRKPLTQYTIISAKGNPAWAPRQWKLQASNNEKHWVTLDRQNLKKPYTKRIQRKIFKFKNKKTYRAYRFIFIPSDKKQFQLTSIHLGRSRKSPFRVTPKSNPTYRRQLNITNAIHTVTYQQKDTRFKREYFSSNPQNVIVLRYTADKKSAYNATIGLTDMHRAAIIAKGNTITATGKLNGYAYRSPTTRKNKYNINLQYESQIKVIHQGGTIAIKNNRIILKNVDAFTILLAADTNYINKRSQKWTRSHPHQRVSNTLKKASQKTFAQLKTAHVKNYQSLFNRLQLDLGKTPDQIRSLPTHQRLRSYKKKIKDPDMEELLFQYARYLMISSSRPGSLPANLQGLWNHSNGPPWRSDYHTDVNVQMNYWFVDQANLSECFEPLAEWLHSIRAVRTEATFKKYGVRGWATRSENGIFGGASYKWVPGDASWVAQNAFDHYAFTRDRKYLRTRLYPILKELSHYWEDSLIKRADGTLVSPAGQSPEHGPHVQGNSYDQQLAYDLFTNFIQCSKDLGVDSKYRRKVIAMRDKLLAPQIGKWGQLQEWEADRDNPKDRHRHLSHLIAVHPGRQISPITTPKLAQAAKVSMNGRGDGATGWSKGWKINVWARLHDGNRAYKLLSEQLRGNFYPNLYGFHPPFQIDGNFGYGAGVCEMLLQSHMGQIHPLPSLPDAWPSGYIKGIKARGALVVDLYWKDKKLSKAIIHVQKDKQKAQASHLKNRVVKFRTKIPVSITSNGKQISQRQIKGQPIILFNVIGGKSYTITPK